MFTKIYNEPMLANLVVWAWSYVVALIILSLWRDYKAVEIRAISPLGRLPKNDHPVLFFMMIVFVAMFFNQGDWSQTQYQHTAKDDFEFRMVLAVILDLGLVLGYWTKFVGYSYDAAKFDAYAKAARQVVFSEKDP